MDYEKAYKELVKNFNAVLNLNSIKQNGAVPVEDIVKMIPKIKKDEDNSIKEELINFLNTYINAHGCTEMSKWVSWIEKQEQSGLVSFINYERDKKGFYHCGKEVSWNEMPLDVRKHDYPYYFEDDLDCFPFNVEKQGVQNTIKQDTEIRDLWVYIKEWRKKFGRLPKDEDELADLVIYVMKRQKPSDKVEPKFRNGQWIVWQDKCYKVNYNGCGYELVDQNGLSTSLEYGTIDENAHLWTIQDAKDGDVLAAKIDKEPNDFIYIFKEHDQNGFSSYCYLDAYINKFHEGMHHNTHNVGVPATKEQRDTLMKAMADAGYIFDFEKKELRKLKFRVGDIVKSKSQPMLDARKIISIDKDCYWCEDRGCIGFAWEDDYEHVEPQPKQEWSEDDDRIRKYIIWHLEHTRTYPDNSINNHVEEAIAWLEKTDASEDWELLNSKQSC